MRIVRIKSKSAAKKKLCSAKSLPIILVVCVVLVFVTISEPFVPTVETITDGGGIGSKERSKLNQLERPRPKDHKGGDEGRISNPSVTTSDIVNVTSDEIRFQNEKSEKQQNMLGSAKEKGILATRESKTLIFHHFYNLKSGTVVQDMLLCHAYAYHHNAIYGGSCGNRTSKHDTHEALLSSVGLAKELIFSCPKDHYGDHATTRKMIPRSKFRNYDTKLWTPDYVNFLKPQVVYPPKVPDKFTIAVHIRRRDVTPCRPHKLGYSRYLPNLHYQILIDKYMQPDARVVIFSQSKSYESLDSFTDKGYEVYVDDNVTDVWSTIAVSDVVIISRSSFSLVPAVVAKGRVVYTPFWHEPLPQWDVVDSNLLNQTNTELMRLEATCP